MPRARTTNNPWEPELLRIGRRLLRGAVASGTQLAIGGFDSIESAITQAVTLPNGEGRRLRLVGASSSGTPDCLADE